MKLKKCRRIAAFVCCLLFCFVMAFSAFFLAAEADHDCTGADCPICAEMQVCANLLHTAALVAAALVVCAIFLAFSGLLSCAYDAKLGPFTLVSLKIKLSD
ncbi:MAG: AraC family transcriptional regulator [Oscillospiraceae bacterium]|nr:AraC family transcriptional regulator [Oscillospiraceae bacterium]